VTLEVEQEISNVANSANTLTPTVQQRKVKSSIAVDSGQTVLLAGLISERKEADHSGIPVLDQIPKLGDVFSPNHSKTVARTEIIMFIRPQIIRNGVDAHFIAEELRSKIRGTIGPSSPTDPHDSKAR
jgi:general secretion pathway protein D